jgi:hypothetical protein
MYLRKQDLETANQDIRDYKSIDTKEGQAAKY